MPALASSPFCRVHPLLPLMKFKRLGNPYVHCCCLSNLALYAFLGLLLLVLVAVLIVASVRLIADSAPEGSYVEKNAARFSMGCMQFLDYRSYGELTFGKIRHQLMQRQMTVKNIRLGRQYPRKQGVLFPCFGSSWRPNQLVV